MKLLFIAPNLPFRPLGGGSVRTYYFTKEWAQRHQIYLVAPVFTPVQAAQVFQYEQELNIYLLPVMVQPLTGWKHTTAYVHRILKGFPPFLHYPELVQYLETLAETYTFDVVYVEGSGFGGSIYFKPFLLQSPPPKFVLAFLDILWHWWKREFFHSPRLSSLVRWLVYRIWEPQFVRDADCCIFMSPIDKRIVEQVVQPKQAVIAPVGVDADLFPVTPVPKTKTMLFVGSFRHQPNLNAAYWLLRDIYPRLRQRIPTSSLVLVGLTPPPDLVSFAASVGVQVYADAPDLLPFYQESRLVVAPIQTGGGVRVKILEACAASRPIVTTTIGAEGLPIVPDEHALFADSTEQFVEAISKVMNDDRLAQSIATKGRLLVEEQFTWAIIAHRIEQTFTAHNLT
ncbi:MAG: glycosyltransferase [Caldilineaceae bacterium]|jgi:glycosyltransferase involved in cell wall biosynthesis|nr:glycosyltransferase [Caldilineaceae bacterium]